MLQTLNESQKLVNYLSENLHLLEEDNHTLNAHLREAIIIAKMGGKKASPFQKGYDYTHPVFGKVELKTTGSVDEHNNDRLSVSGLRSKENKCDFVHIVDFVNEVHFMLPHDEVFNGSITLHCNKDRLRWSGSYNELDDTQPGNTSSLLFHRMEDIDWFGTDEPVVEYESPHNFDQDYFDSLGKLPDYFTRKFLAA